MSRSTREDERLLTGDERELVARTRQPAVKGLADSDLSDLVRRLREQRDRAREIARRQRREMRGKSRPSGASPARDNTGTKAKGDLLAAAVKRANSEVARRRAAEARSDMVASAERALEMKRSAPKPSRPASRTPGEGMRASPNRKDAVSGALTQEGQRAVLERSRKVR